MEMVGGGGSVEGGSLNEISEAQLSEAVSEMEVGCTTKQHLVCVDVDGVGVIGTCLFSGIILLFSFILFQFISILF